MKIRNAEDEATKSGQVTLKYKFTIDMPEYAKRFGIEVPDDSSDTLNDNEDSACREELTDAQDASITVVGTPLSKCKANNPLTCRFHGTQAIANDIEAMMRAAGVQGNVNVDINGVSGNLLTVTAQITASAKDQPKIEAAMKQFFALPGVAGDTVDLIFDKSKNQHENLFQVDMLDPNASTKWGFGQNANQPQTKAKPKAKKPKQPQATPPSAPQPQVSAPTPAAAPVAPSPVIPPAQHGGRLHPPAPPKVTKAPVPDFTQKDLDFLTDARNRLEPLARCLNGRVGDIQRLQASSRFANLDALPQDTAFYTQLDALTKNNNKQISDAAKELLQIANNIKNSKAANWTISAGMIDTESDFDAKLPQVQAIPEPPKSAAEIRLPDLNVIKGILSSSDPTAPKNAAADLQKLHDDLEDMENSVAELDDAISKEQDPAVLQTLNDLRDELDGSYYDTNNAYKNAKQAVMAWLGKQHMMLGSIQDTMDALKAKGQKIPAYMKNWQTQINKTRGIAASNASRATGLSTSEVDRIANANCKSLYDRACKEEVSIGSQGEVSYFLEMLDGKHAFGDHLDGRYSPIARNCFGAAPSADMSAFCRVLEGDASNFPSWWYGDCVCIVNPRKAVLGINAHLYDGASNYGQNLQGSNLVLMTDANASVLNCSKVGGGIVSRDCSNDSTRDFMRNTDLDDGNEVHVLGGITVENCLACKFFRKVPDFTPQQKAVIRQYGIKIYGPRGNLVSI